MRSNKKINAKKGRRGEQIFRDLQAINASNELKQSSSSKSNQRIVRKNNYN